MNTYPAGTVRDLLDTDLVSDATRTTLRERLNATPARAFFTPEEYATLQAVTLRLFPPSSACPDAGLAASLDERLAKGEGNGWRYDAMPHDQDAHRLGLRGLDETAQEMHGAPFLALDGTQQDAILHAIQGGSPAGATWQQMPATRYFEELLAELSEFYYSHPLVQEQIGYVGMADQRGWQRIGLDEREAWEPEQQQTGNAQQIPATQHQVFANDAGKEQPVHRAMSSEPCDVVVIGTGAGGAPLLARLAAAGLRVVALEAGREWNPAKDWPTDERGQSALFWNDERLSAGKDPLAFGNNNSGTGVGGSTLHYTAYTPRAHPDDFRIASDFGVGMDWPLVYDELEHYYTEIEHFIGVSGPTPYPWGPARGQGYPQPPLPLNGAALLMQRACTQLGINTSPAPNAALAHAREQPGYGHRPACSNRGFCQAGCTTGAKSSTDVTFIPLARLHGAEIRPNCYVTGFERDAQGQITAVIYQQHGTEQRQHCNAVFLCGGAIETPRMLLMHGMANSSGQVGRNFLAHPGLQIWGQFDEDIRPYKGIPGGLISEDTHRPADADFVGGYLLQSIGVMPVTYASQLARGRGLWGAQLQEHMQGYNHTAGINILGDCLPYDHNFLELSDEKDARGLPKPRIHFTQGENERRMTAHAERMMRAIWEAAGARDIWAFYRNAHIIGTCRMGHDPATSVVDANCRSHDIPNLYIVDNSIFPSALSVNPALTIMALSLRAADRFLANRP